jgi:hypothetical protein
LLFIFSFKHFPICFTSLKSFDFIGNNSSYHSLGQYFYETLTWALYSGQAVFSPNKPRTCLTYFWSDVSSSSQILLCLSPFWHQITSLFFWILLIFLSYLF